jgi:hypothetical protein
MGRAITDVMCVDAPPPTEHQKAHMEGRRSLRPAREEAYAMYQESLRRMLILAMIESTTMWDLSDRVAPPSLVELREEWNAQAEPQTEKIPTRS